MKIAVVSVESPADPASWSGIPFHMVAELVRRGADVQLVETPMLDAFARRTNRLRRLGVLPRRETLFCHLAAHRVERALLRIQPDVVLALNAEHKIAFLSDRWPLVLCAGALFGTIAAYYPEFSRLSSSAVRQGDRQERRIIDRDAEIVLATDWAARAAADYYEVDLDRFTVIPMGANLAVAPTPPPRRVAGPLRLLFVGRDWPRKGGPFVLALHQRLRSRLGEVELDIIGCRPPAAMGLPGVRVHGPVRRGQPGGADIMADHFRRASFLVSPARAEIFGVALCEAFAFGLPVLATRTGGVGGVVTDGQDGLLFDLEASLDTWVDTVASVWGDGASYEAMCRQARRSWETRLNWHAWGDQIMQILERRRGASGGGRLEGSKAA